MENDQATRLRALVRQARLVASVDVGPPRLVIVSLEGMAPHQSASHFARSLVAAAAAVDVRLGSDKDLPESDWVYTKVTAPASRVDDTDLAGVSAVLALSETTPSALLATYALIKQLHSQGGPTCIDVVFVGESDECQRADEGLRGTCERFLGWPTLATCHWANTDDAQGLQELVCRLTERLAVARPGHSPTQNSLAAEPCEPV